MSNKPVTDALKKLLADSYTLMLKTHNYHWNVEGPNFASLHTLFEGQYTELFAAADTIAERLRGLGEKAPGSYAEFSKLSKVKEAIAGADAETMLADLYQSNAAVSLASQKLFEVADKAEDQATADLANQRTAAHDKAAWMLKSSLPKGAKLKVAV